MNVFHFVNRDTGENVTQDNSTLPSNFELSLRNANSYDILRMLFPNGNLSGFESKVSELDSYEKISDNQILSLEKNFQDQVLFNLKTFNYSNFVLPDLIDAIFEPNSQARALELLLARKNDGIFVQVGGNGIHAVKSLLLGFQTAVLVTPVKSELIRAFRLAAALGVRERIFGYIGLGENLPIENEAVDCVYFGGCLHHTSEIESWRESLRILRSGGISIAVESFEAPLYKFGVSIFGKREKDVNCIILDKKRMEVMLNNFEGIKYEKSGFLYRYALLAAFSKVKNIKTLKGLIRLQLVLDRMIPRKINHFFGSSILIRQEKI